MLILVRSWYLVRELDLPCPTWNWLRQPKVVHEGILEKILQHKVRQINILDYPCSGFDATRYSPEGGSNPHMEKGKVGMLGRNCTDFRL